MRSVEKEEFYADRRNELKIAKTEQNVVCALV